MTRRLDALMVTGGPPPDLDDSLPPAPTSRIELPNGVAVCKLGEDRAELVLDACEPRGYGYTGGPVRHYWELYSYIAEAAEPGGSWDSDQRIQRVVARTTRKSSSSPRTGSVTDARPIVESQMSALGRETGAGGAVVRGADRP